MAKPPKLSDTDFELQKREWLMCTGKVGFETFEKADKRAQDLGYVCYQCPYCDKWHLSKRAGRLHSNPRIERGHDDDCSCIRCRY